MRAARNLRTVERFLLAPPLAADFGPDPVSICDISAGGARFRHKKPLETGRKAALKVPMEGKPSPLALEAVVVWTQSEGGGSYVSGVRTYGAPEAVNALITQLQTSKRSTRIEELRSTDRFFVAPSIEVKFGENIVSLENISARGARFESLVELRRGQTGKLTFRVPKSELDVDVEAKIVWTTLKAISGGHVKTFRAGALIAEKPELMRLAIALLCDSARATLDTQSLTLKLKIMRARARQIAASTKSIEASGVPVEQYLLIQGVRQELLHNPEEALHWYRRARIVINDRKTRDAAPLIADHPDAIAVWEYLDRSVDSSMIARALNIAR